MQFLWKSAVALFLEHKIDEIYCSEKELNPDQLNALIDFADNNLKIIKFLPDEKRLSSQSLTREYYDYIPVLSLRHMPLESLSIAKLKEDSIFCFAFGDGSTAVMAHSSNRNFDKIGN